MSADENTELAAAVEAAGGALPMPVAPVPQALSAERLAEIRSLDLLSMMSDSAASVVSGHLAALVCEVDRLWGERDEFCNRVDTLTAVAQGNKRHVQLMFVELQKAQRERGEAQARVAELEAERHSTNEALDDAVQALRAKEASGSYAAALPWAALMDDEDLLDFLDELTDAATTNVSCVERLAEVERACGTWRLIAEAQHAHNTAPGPDAVTRVFVSVASLREPEGEHYAVVHHDYLKGRELPEMKPLASDQTHTGCGMPLTHRLECGHCPHEVCQDCDRCPCSCRCSSGGGV